MALAIKRLLAGDASIGDVKYSYLSEAQFVAENGLGWVLDDGRSIVGSKLHQKYGFTTTSDARGMFLRAANNNRTGTYADPGGNRAAGSIQGHAFQTHTHTQNAHSHGVTDPGHAHSISYWSPSGGAYGLGGGASSVQSGTGSNTTGISVGNATATNQSQSATGAASEPTAAETRPVNMAFNVFVKIN